MEKAAKLNWQQNSQIPRLQNSGAQNRPLFQVCVGAGVIEMRVVGGGYMGVARVVGVTASMVGVVARGQ